MPTVPGIAGQGFADPVLDSQSVFRSLLAAMSRPGSIVPLLAAPQAPRGLGQTVAAVCLSLLDFDTPLWLPESLRFSEVAHYLQFHCGCPLTDDPAKAAFAVIGRGEDTPSLKMFNSGTPEYPDRSTTLIIQVESLDCKGGATLKGPGIEDTACLKVEGLPRAFWREFSAQRNDYPLGVDVFLATHGSVAGLPRSVDISQV